MRRLVRLGQHGCGSLLDDLVFSQVGRSSCVVGIHHGTARGSGVGGDVGQVVCRVRHLVDARTNGSALAVNRIDRSI